MNFLDFSYALVGGLLIGLSSVGLMLALGRIAGISGILQAAIFSDDKLWRILFLFGMIVGAWFVFWLNPAGVSVRVDFPLPILAVSGFLVGLGVAMGNGCTSGHGICGLSRFSKRSVVATMLFFACALLTRFILHTVLGVL